MAKNSWGYFLIKSVLLGIIVSLVLLLLIPDLRQGSGLSVNLFDPKQQGPEKLSFYQAINRAAPAVVNIYSIRNETRSLLFRRQSIERTNLGSGVIMNERGYILTCFHVIRDAEQIIVRLQDGRDLEAQQVGYDPYTDLAVLKVSADNLPVMPQMSEQASRVGDVVLAIGNPYNLGQTTTQGIISATGRVGLSNYLSNQSYADFIQMDAVLNEGNSGGALVDSNGYLVGINNANFKTLDSQRRVKDVAGVFFAVPYELAKKVMDSIISHGRVIRGYLGINVTEVNRVIEITATMPGGPAEAAGIQPGDILQSINGQALDSAHMALDMVAETPPGTTLQFGIMRDNRAIEVPVTITELKE